ncbi:MAG: hypothetical protein NO474_01445 [Methanomassiliicoccales archaeon]|jgi:hypothetical protein|nr:hypothetical protein [Methanomassiliicoccales archaeon]
MNPLLVTPKEFELIIIALLLVFGIALAFVGHRIYESILAVAGVVLGFVIGFTIGSLFGGIIVAYILGTLGAIFLALVFYYYVATAMSLIASAAVFLLAHALGVGLIISLIIAAAVFVIVFLTYDRIVALFTALVGATLVAWALDIIGFQWFIIVVVFFITTISGTIVQWVDISSKKPRPIESGNQPSKIDIVKRCPNCGHVLTYMPEYDAWFCYSCGKYS